MRTTADVAQVIDGADIVVFAIKPQEFDAAAHHLDGRFRRDQTVVSIMAGVPIDRIARALSHAGIVRVMPNTPAAIGEGMSVWTATPEVDEAAREQVGAILGAMGREVYVDDEKYLDMATALSGSGPGFVYLLLEAFIDAGVHVGFKRDVAEMLALQTFIGSREVRGGDGQAPGAAAQRSDVARAARRRPGCRCWRARASAARSSTRSRRRTSARASWGPDSCSGADCIGETCGIAGRLSALQRCSPSRSSPARS